MKNPDVFPAEIVRCKDLEEETDRRAMNSKTYSLGDNKHRLRKAMGAVHYKDGGIQSDDPWKEIDLTIKDNGDHYAITPAPYDLKIYKDKIKYSYVSRQGGRVDVELNSIGDTPMGDVTVHPELVSDHENRLLWSDPVTGIDFFISARSLQLSLYKSIKNKDAPRKFVWDVFEDVVSKARFKRGTAGCDKNQRNMEISNTVDDKGTKISEETGNEYRHLRFTEEWSGRVSEIKDKRTRIKKWIDKPVYPAVIDADTDEILYPATIDADVTETITTNVDDGNDVVISINGGYVGTTYFYLATGIDQYFFLGYGKVHPDGTDWYTAASNGGVRFQTIGIPQGAIIDSAKLILQVHSAADNTIATKIYGDDVDNAAAWANGNLPRGITKTTASKAWTPATIAVPTTTTINITSIAQEIVSRPLWASGNNMRFAILNKLTGVTGRHHIFIYDYNKAQANAAVLQIDWSHKPPPPMAPNLKILTKGGAMVGGGAKLPLHPWRHTRG